MMSLGHVTEVNTAMPKGHRVLVALIGKFSNEFDRLARSDLLVDVTAAIDPCGRFVSEVRYPGWIRPDAAFLEQGQRVRPALPLSGLRRCRARPEEKRVGHRQRDQRQNHERASKTITVPAYDRTLLEVGNQGRGQPGQ